MLRVSLAVAWFFMVRLFGVCARHGASWCRIFATSLYMLGCLHFSVGLRALRLIGTLAKSRQAGITIIGFWITFRTCFASL